MQLVSGEVREIVPRKRIFQHDRGLNFEVLVQENRTIATHAAQPGEGVQRVIITLLHQQPTGRVWKEQHPNTEDDGWDNLQGQGETPRHLGLPRAATSRDVMVRVEDRL